MPAFFITNLPANSLFSFPSCYLQQELLRDSVIMNAPAVIFAAVSLPSLAAGDSSPPLLKKLEFRWLFGRSFSFHLLIHFIVGIVWAVRENMGPP